MNVKMTFKKISSKLDDAGTMYLIEGKHCKRVSLDHDLFSTSVEKGDFLIPVSPDIKAYFFPDKAYKVLDQWHEGGKKAVEVRKKGIIRDLVLELFYEGFYRYSGLTDKDIERHYSKE